MQKLPNAPSQIGDRPRPIERASGRDLPGATLPLPIERIDLWTVDLVAERERIDACFGWLSPDERERAARLVFEADRRRFAITRGALRAILASYLGCSPAAIVFRYGEHGKPSLGRSDRSSGNEAPSADRSPGDTNSNPAGIEFNVSRSGDRAMVAVTVGPMLGVDIEVVREAPEDRFVEQHLSAMEQEAYRSLLPAEQPAAFYRLWTLKEAYLKATGAGLSEPLASIEFHASPGERPQLMTAGRTPGGEGGWTCVDLQPGPRHVGALVVAGKACPVQDRHWAW